MTSLSTRCIFNRSYSNVYKWQIIYCIIQFCYDSMFDNNIMWYLSGCVPHCQRTLSQCKSQIVDNCCSQFSIDVRGGCYTSFDCNGNSYKIQCLRHNEVSCGYVFPFFNIFRRPYSGMNHISQQRKPMDTINESLIIIK